MRSYLRIGLMLASVLVLAGLIFHVGSLSRKPAVSETKTPVPAADHEIITENTGRWLIQIRYPVLGNAAIDRSISEFINSEIQNFKSNAIDPSTLPGEPKPNWKNELRIEYTTSQFSSSVKSIIFEELSFTGGAHPNHYTASKTYDVNTGEEITLPKIFNPGSGYIKQISEISYAELSQSIQNPIESMLREGTDPSHPENFSDFALSEQGITFIFDPYQVAPYVYGTQKVFISFARVKDILQARFIPEF